MSVIENPTAYLNETNQVSYDEPTPMTKPAEKKSPVVKPGTSLDETPLSSDKEKSMSPRQLNCTTNTTSSAVSTDKLCSASDLPEISLSSQIGDKQDSECVSKASDSNKDKSCEEPKPDSKQEPETGSDSKSGKETNNILALATTLESDDSEDEEYVPGVDPDEANEEQDEEKEEEEIVSRQYSLRDGIKGTEVEESKEVSHDDAEKKRADDIWSAFKADVAVPIKRKAKELETTIKEKTYDFAGEAVTVREEIKSKRKSLASTLGLDKSRKRRRESAPILSRTEEEEKSEGSTTSDPSNLNSTTTTGTKRSRPVSKLNSLVNRLTKRPKMTVLNKTALDWNKFKKDNNIEEDVKNEAKAEGYLEKQDFLNRADQKQFELEREIRAQQARRRQMMNSKQF